MITDLRAGRVGVRTPRLADLDVLCRTDADSLPADTPEPADRRSRLRARIEQPSDLLSDGICFFTVGFDGEPVGDIQARAPRLGFPPGVCELGISLLASRRGAGIGRAAVGLLTEHLFDVGWARVQGSTRLDNVAMCRAFEHAGFAFEGVARGYLPDESGGRNDCAVYARVSPTLR